MVHQLADGAALPLDDASIDATFANMYLHHCPDPVAAIREMASELTAMAAAPTVDEYAGPVLFEGDAAAQFVSQLFAAQLSPTKTPLTADEWLRRELPDAKLAGRVRRRVFPDFVTVRDDPTLARFGDVDLRGYYRYDDEGVPASNVTLVEGGILRTFLMSRSPVEGFPQSNGHGRRQPGYRAVARQGNLIVESSKAVSFERLRELDQSAPRAHCDWWGES